MRHSKKFLSGLVIFLLIISCDGPQSVSEQSPLHIIPNPVEMITQDGDFIINGKTIIHYLVDNDLEKEATYLTDLIEEISGLEVKVSDQNRSKNTIGLSVNSDMSNPEGYVLSVLEDGISIEGGSPSGVFYGIQTLRQLFPEVPEDYRGKLSAACCEMSRALF